MAFKSKNNGIFIKSFLILFVATLLSFEGTSVRHNVTFGVKVGIMPTGSIIQFAVIHFRGGKKVSIQPVSKQELTKIATGEWPVPRTSIFHDFFKEQGIYDLYKKDTTKIPPIDFNAAIDSLWKIRFVEHPFESGKGKGWSQGNARPSLKQQEFIYNNYGVRGYDQDFFIDTSFFKLIHDVVDPVWIENYKSLK